MIKTKINQEKINNYIREIKSYSSFGKLILLIGKKGSGKTLFMCFKACCQKIRKIYANLEYKLSNYYQLRIDDIFNLPKDIDIHLDELYSWLESRTSSKGINRHLSYIMYELRKMKSDIYCSLQDLSTVDKRYRREADFKIYCFNDENKERFVYSYYKRVFYDVIDDYIYIYVGKKYISYVNAIKYFKIYDTNQVIKPLSQSRLEYQIKKEDSKSYIKEVEKIAKIMNVKLRDKQLGKDITHSSLELDLMRNGFDIGYQKHVYAEIKVIRKKEKD